jgi:hypothetical protein
MKNMEVYFKNDGSYGQGAVKAPIVANDRPIGFIDEVTEEQVTCYLWDKFVYKEQIGFSAFSKEQDIRAIRIEC